MDEPDIRRWAWDQVTNYRVLHNEKTNTTYTELRDHRDRIARADDLAAWVMSGNLPK